MANTAYPFTNSGVSVDTGENKRLYNISINQSGFNTTNGNAAAGGVNPSTWRDYSSYPATANQARDLGRGNSRYKKMIQILGTYSNFTIHKLALDSSADQDTQPTSMTFNISFENDSALPSSGTSLDGSTALANREAVIKDLIATALSASYEEVVEIYDVTGTPDRAVSNELLTISPVDDQGSIVAAVTVTRIGEFDSIGDAEATTNNA